ncbi:hypothetical protein BDW59DRAFT_139586 [Aspergillus cavernicola]|uniref:Uncharacterized protein n=1 Tax=Aspergillus cavernicola TaxID=176166 RepID=A0ABR4IW85_9EURO
MFWRKLGVFWKDETINKWMKAASNNETTANLMCKCQHVHGLRGKAQFVIRPINATSMSMTVEFCWLPAGTVGGKALLETPFIDKDLESSPRGL